MKTEISNIASRMSEKASVHPHRRAVVVSTGTGPLHRTAYAHLTFRQLDKASDRVARGILSSGIQPGHRAILMVPPGMEFFILVFALFKCGVIPVVVDPGMGIKRMVQCHEQSRPQAFIGIPKAHLLRFLYPGFFKSIKVWITVGKQWFRSGPTFDRLLHRPGKPFQAIPTQEEDPAAILFTTGSTGPAKGVVYTHGIFNAQINAIGDYFNIRDGEIDLPTFPLFSLFDPALGMTAVIPDMDPTKPAKADPAKLFRTIFDHGITNMFASPALLYQLGEFGVKNKIKLSSLRRVVSAGAPVSPDTISMFSELLPHDVQVHTPYGATEAMPVSCVGGDEILQDTAGFSKKGYGMCVGRPLPGMDVRLIGISDNPIPQWSGELEVASGEIGEFTVKGNVVTKQYFQNDDADRMMKIQEASGIRHRMGDLGWMDQQGRLWFCGRKSHRVRINDTELYTIPCEAIFNNHPSVYRSALVGVGPRKKRLPVICIELIPNINEFNKDKFIKELRSLAAQNPMTANIERFLIHPGFPTDIRHNAKIFREKLAAWAQKKLA